MLVVRKQMTIFKMVHVVSKQMGHFKMVLVVPKWKDNFKMVLVVSKWKDNFKMVLVVSKWKDNFKMVLVVSKQIGRAKMVLVAPKQNENIYVAPIGDDMLFCHDLLHHLGVCLDMRTDTLVLNEEIFPITTSFKYSRDIVARMLEGGEIGFPQIPKCKKTIYC